MKIGLANDEDQVSAGPSFVEHIGRAAAALKAIVGADVPVQKTEAWLAGYNAFYNGVHSNPYGIGSEKHAEWDLGSKAFEQDFEW